MQDNHLLDNVLCLFIVVQVFGIFFSNCPIYSLDINGEYLFRDKESELLSNLNNFQIKTDYWFIAGRIIFNFAKLEYLAMAYTTLKLSWKSTSLCHGKCLHLIHLETLKLHHSIVRNEVYFQFLIWNASIYKYFQNGFYPIIDLVWG